MFTSRALALCAAAIGLFLAGCSSHAGGIVPNTTSQDAPQSATLLPQSTTTTLTVRKHLMTGDYLMGNYGTTSVSPSRAATVLDWAQTSTNDANVIAAAGIKTQIYFDPNRWATYDTLYQTATEPMFAHSCSGARITSVYKTLVRYVTDPRSTAMQSHYGSYVAARTSGAHVDSVFEDDAGPLAEAAQYNFFSPGLPCSYSDTSWINGEMALDNAVPKPVVVNGLGILNGHDPSLLTKVLVARNVLGGVYEHCFSNNTQTKMTSWAWTAMENSQLTVLHEGKQFWCMARNTQAASGQTDARTWVLASFLLTYDLSKSLLWEEFQTPSGLHVMPESKLVALNSTTSLPATVDGLKTSSGNYGREFANCYMGGTSVGPCAVIVNNDRWYSHPNPYGTKYRHTLYLAGNGILDGGVAYTSGAAPPSSIPPVKAYVVFR